MYYCERRDEVTRQVAKGEVMSGFRLLFHLKEFESD